MKSTIIAIVVGSLLIAGAIVLSSGNRGSVNTSTNVNNVSIVDGKQIVEISVKGGYQPQRSVAKAGLPTIIRFITNGTFDCSSSIRIPTLGINQLLPQSGNTDIDAGTQQVGILQGTCGMGMYRFQVDFQG